MSSHDKAVLDLKVQRDKLTQYQKKMRAVVEKETEMARELLRKGQRPKALLALKKKRFQEQLLTKSEAQLSNLQEMIDSVEFAQMEKRVFDGLKAGNEVLKEIQAEMSLDAVEELMADTQEAIAHQQEIENILAGKLTDEDEEAILAELDELVQQAEQEGVPQMPEVPAGEPTATDPQQATAAKTKVKAKRQEAPLAAE